MSDLDSFNNGKTWAWNGFAIVSTMVSTSACPRGKGADAALARPVSNAECGPIKLGSQLGPGDNLVDLQQVPSECLHATTGVTAVSLTNFASKPKGLQEPRHSAHRGRVVVCRTAA